MSDNEEPIDVFERAVPVYLDWDGNRPVALATSHMDPVTRTVKIMFEFDPMASEDLERIFSMFEIKALCFAGEPKLDKEDPEIGKHRKVVVGENPANAQLITGICGAWVDETSSRICKKDPGHPGLHG